MASYPRKLLGLLPNWDDILDFMLWVPSLTSGETQLDRRN